MVFDFKKEYKEMLVPEFEDTPMVLLTNDEMEI